MGTNNLIILVPLTKFFMTPLLIVDFMIQDDICYKKVAFEEKNIPFCNRDEYLIIYNFCIDHFFSQTCFKKVSTFLESIFCFHEKINVGIFEHQFCNPKRCSWIDNLHQIATITKDSNNPRIHFTIIRNITFLFEYCRFGRVVAFYEGFFEKNIVPNSSYSITKPRNSLEILSPLTKNSNPSEKTLSEIFFDD